MNHLNPDIGTILLAIPNELHEDFFNIYEKHLFPSQEFERFMDANPAKYWAAMERAMALDTADKYLLSGALLSSEKVKNDFLNLG